MPDTLQVISYQPVLTVTASLKVMVISVVLGTFAPEAGTIDSTVGPVGAGPKQLDVCEPR